MSSSSCVLFPESATHKEKEKKNKKLCEKGRRRRRRLSCHGRRKWLMSRGRRVGKTFDSDENIGDRLLLLHTHTHTCVWCDGLA
jgi:hypothetical protein